MQDCDALSRHYAMPGRLSFLPDALGLPVAEVSTAACRARIALRGAQVLAWRPAGEAEVLFLSPLPPDSAGRAMRGGIPVCWPWFAAHPADASQPFHGYVRTAVWSLVAAADDGAAGVRLRFERRWQANDAAAADVALTIVAGRSLTLELATTNRADGALALTQALHTYLAVGDISEVAVLGLAGAAYIDKVAGNARRREVAEEVAVSGEVDRIYLGPGGARLVDRRLGRSIGIASAGTSRSTVVWSPGPERALAFPDLPGDCFRRFLCIETANAGDDVVTVAPGDSYTLRAEIAVEPA
jgi:glucose-6-phosphate 1-epimerase